MATSTTEQDFFQIKENLKTYLRSQTEFADYDFDGAALTTLLDVMAFNTHYSAITANMSVNEMFLDTAQVRNNVISHAKGLGYTTQSNRSAYFIGDITADTTATLPVIIPRGSTFKTSGTKPLIFTTLSDFTTTPVAGIATFTGVTAYEGKMIQNTYTVGSEEQKYEIPNKFCDTTTLRVEVQTNAASTDKKIYKLGKYLTDTLSTSEVYFLQEGFDEKYEVYFGDNIIGKKLAIDNVISFEYLKTSGSTGNSIQQFTFASTVSGLSNVTVATTTPSTGGANIETINSIKKNAPFNYAAQNRAVTAEDYNTIIQQIYPNIDSINVWGGEDNDPPVYGKVYASVKPSSGSVLTTGTKTLIEDGLKRYKVSSIIPVIVDPEYMYLLLDISFKYNSGISNLSASELKTKIQTVSDTYNTDVLTRFNNMYRNSNMTSLVDAADTAIVSSTVRHKVRQYITPVLNTAANYVISFSNVIYHPHSGHLSTSATGVVTSNAFYRLGNTTTLYYMEDDGMGNIKLYHKASGTNVVTIDDAKFGTVDYVTGKITIPTLSLSGFSGTDTTLVFTVELDSFDVVPVRNQILQIESTTINAIEDTIASGTYSGNTNYTTTPSRL
jgi:hypothetical protein